MYKERRLDVKFNAVAEWFPYFPFQYVIFTAIDISHSASANQSATAHQMFKKAGYTKVSKLCIDLQNK
jgi:hypothetical protein